MGEKLDCAKCVHYKSCTINKLGCTECDRYVYNICLDCIGSDGCEDDLINFHFVGTCSSFIPRTEIKDSGNRKEFSTGAVRDIQEGKGRFDLIPYEMMERLAKHYEAGAKKYGERNWQKGIPSWSCVNSAMRHLAKYNDGWKDEDHLSAVIFNIAAIMYYEKNIPETLKEIE